MDKSGPESTLLPAQIQLEANKRYYWCQCGLSQIQPFCDGSHRGSGVNPMAFSVGETGPVLLCVCKETGNPPFCDCDKSRS
ncbi:MAG: CDGSH iron-sulfur domain-containing protein [Nitrosomonas sp.]|uniref:CDGSH iron-sulfur domain-containing protein n=1 Tax=Nitrosomonas sp. TaxID=42353 RepID=UPI002561E205|nr:CDGSH iron-sulfur domain-containing protein [Nitrosomonas sp.]MBE7526899.1 CDGSH iron-sulfur domain-containing protein [Burkholderiales bacterium]MCC6161288.1 CDGSH iron-sulfur domain-containing protein [Nitrosomonas sp.]MDL1865740.1 CDGSH iron-sulfur domain-containing protein [Betaproteobacteria bacterium PRO4]